MLIIFDLDYTLLDTESFKKGLAEALGLTTGQFNNSYKKYFKERAIPYNIDQHIAYLASVSVETGEAAKLRLKDFFSTIDKYLFADAESVLGKLKLGGHKLVLLTYGDVEWQKQKFNNLKIKKYFAEIIYTDKGKGDVGELRRMAEERKDVLIVNDNARESLEIKKKAEQAEIFLIDGPYANNCEHNLERRKLEDIDKFFNR
ncbi:MAG: HAD hydrolase-like protein [bacterium]